MYDASISGGDLSISWNVTLAQVDPILYTFQSTFGMNLRSLRLVGIGLTEIPEEVGSLLFSLELLSLSNNSLQILPDNIVNLGNLRELHLMYNKIQKLPDKIGNLCLLRKFSIHNNLLEFLPITFGALNQIEKVDLECNKLTVLPENLEGMTLCKSLNINNNRLVRLPRCLARMPSLTVLSASCNHITYIPNELFSSKTLQLIRLNTNKISVVPERIGELGSRLVELSLDYNLINELPSSFWKLSGLKILRVEGNVGLINPPQTVIVNGAAAVVEYCTQQYFGNEVNRMRIILLATQNALQQIDSRGLAESAFFEPHSKLDGNADEWYAFHVDNFFNDLLPKLKKIWQSELRRGVDHHREGWISSFDYSQQDVLWAGMNYTDAYGKAMLHRKAIFRLCRCSKYMEVPGDRKLTPNDDPLNNPRHPCVPPKVGFMCERPCALIKMHLVTQGDKQERLWKAYKESGYADAVKRAEFEARRYLDSIEGKLWLEKLAYDQAEEMLLNLGAEEVVELRIKEAEDKKKAIIKKFDRLKGRIEKKRDKKAEALQLEVNELKVARSTASEGYFRNVIDQRIGSLTTKMANLVENIELEKLHKQCEFECEKIDESLYESDSEELSLDDSDDDDERLDLYSSDDDSSEAERWRRKQEKKKSRRDELRKLEDLKMRASENEAVAKKKEKKLDRMNRIEFAGAAFQKLVIDPLAKSLRKNARIYQKRLKRTLRDVAEISKIRVKKLFKQVTGNFDEIQRELRYELHHQYISHHVKLAQQDAMREFSAIDSVRQTMRGIGMKLMFETWRDWTLTKLQRKRRDIRSKYRQATKGFDAAMQSVGIAEAQVNLWIKKRDVYTDRPYWQHSLNGDVTFDKPNVRHYLPPNFAIPDPPEDLPQGISFETSSDESVEEILKARKLKRDLVKTKQQSVGIQSSSMDKLSVKKKLTDSDGEGVEGNEDSDDESESDREMIRDDHAFELDQGSVDLVSSLGVDGSVGKTFHLKKKGEGRDTDRVALPSVMTGPYNDSLHFNSTQENVGNSVEGSETVPKRVTKYNLQKMSRSLSNDNPSLLPSIYNPELIGSQQRDPSNSLKMGGGLPLIASSMGSRDRSAMDPVHTVDIHSYKQYYENLAARFESSSMSKSVQASSNIAESLDASSIAKWVASDDGSVRSDVSSSLIEDSRPAGPQKTSHRRKKGYRHMQGNRYVLREDDEEISLYDPNDSVDGHGGGLDENAEREMMDHYAFANRTDRTAGKATAPSPINRTALAIAATREESNRNDDVEERSVTSLRIEQAIEKAREYIENSSQYATRVANAANMRSDDQPVGDVLTSEQLRRELESKSKVEFDAAYKQIRKKRNQLNVVRHKTYIRQMNRKPTSMEQVKANERVGQERLMQQQAASISEALGVRSGDEKNGMMDGKAKKGDVLDVLQEMAKEGHKIDLVNPSTEDLLRLAGGHPDMVFTGKDGLKLRTVLAQRALQIKEKLYHQAVQQNLAPPKVKSFYEREIAPLFADVYHGGSSEDSDEEGKLQAKRALQKRRKEKMKHEGKIFERIESKAAAAGVKP